MADEKRQQLTEDREDLAALDAALAAAFAADHPPPAPDGNSAGSALWRSPLATPGVALREPPGDVAEPVIKPHSDQLPPAGGGMRRYQLQGEIARGGMGVVLRGRDVDLGRDLAIKLLLDSHKRNPQMTQRFVEEAQIAGQLQHPGIAPVYELGTADDARPFFAMKLVKGQTLSALLDKRRTVEEDLPRFVGIFEHVCQTMAYAHSRGVIHRDLKPSNVMVGAFGEVQVMDWGLAKVLAEGGVADDRRDSHPRQSATGTAPDGSGSTRAGSQTHAGSVIGTPAFMPPEQASGHIDRLDERCDVFGLGAILCVILTGAPPYTGSDGSVVRRRAAEGDLSEAFARLYACRAEPELAQLARRCLAPEAADRPRDAGAVADQVAAYLQSVESRLRQAELAQAEASARAGEERKRRKLTLALAASVLLIVGVSAAAWGWLAHRENRYQAEQARQRLLLSHREKLHQAEQAHQRLLLTQQVNDALADAERLRQQAVGAAPEDPLALTQARGALRRAAALLETGTVAPELAARVEQFRRQLDEAQQRRRLATALLAARDLQTTFDANEGRFLSELAIPAYESALRAHDMVVGQTEPARAAAWVASQPEWLGQLLIAALDHWILLEEFAEAADRKSWLLAVVRAASPDPWRNRVRELLDQRDWEAVAELSHDAEAEAQPPAFLATISIWLWHTKRRTDAIALLRRAQRKHPDDFWLNAYLGMWLAQVNPPDLPEAVRFATAAAALRPHNAGAQLNLGVVLMQNGQLEEAMQATHTALRLKPDFAKAHTNLGNTLRNLGRYEEAVAEHLKAIDLRPDWPSGHLALGHALYLQGDYPAAIAALQKAQQLEPGEPRTHELLGLALAAGGDSRAAIDAYRTALTLDANQGTYNNLGLVLHQLGQRQAAIASYHKALEVMPDMPEAHHNLGRVYLDLGQPEQAIANFQKAILLRPSYSDAHNNLGLAYKAQGRMQESIDSHRRAVQIDPNNAKAYNNLGLALLAAGADSRQALEAFERAVQLQPDLAKAYMGRGYALRNVGRLADALESFEQGQRIGFSQPQLRKQAADLVAAAKRRLLQQSQLPRLLDGTLQPETATERAGFATVCFYTGDHASAVKLFSEAFADDPALADDPETDDRYVAACSAVRAATVAGEEAEQRRLRQQGLAWLRADLARIDAQIDAAQETSRRVFLRRVLQYWQRDANLAGIRDAQYLDPLALDEQAACRRLWTDVAGALYRAGHAAAD